MLRNILIFSLILSTITLLSGCASKTTAVENEDQLLESAQQSLNKGIFNSAVLKLESFEQQYPFSRYIEKIQIDLIYAKYKNHSLEDSIIRADRFIRLHPEHEQVAYAWYLKALATYDLSRSNRSVISGKDISTRDPKIALKAFDYFSTYLQNFPDHKYVPDARLKQLDIRNRLASYEVQVAQFYLKKGAWVAAVNRATAILEEFPGSPSVLDALNILEIAYLEMDQKGLAADVTAVKAGL